MPHDSTSKSSKTKGIKNLARVLSDKDSDLPSPYAKNDDGESVLPSAFRLEKNFSKKSPERAPCGTVRQKSALRARFKAESKRRYGNVYFVGPMQAAD
ncbi:hypothetical protein HPB50_007486 [Hyalomma asiaticum]|uniref:Uncharacterized protein n=1 Tax=Hyalomma asiaticum TaxID=266040 RepID=A0ACB7S479_HYAAI|nr:hypothetical protein HPB50_007486 [Hyalomma asiaticum]